MVTPHGHGCSGLTWVSELWRWRETIGHSVGFVGDNGLREGPGWHRAVVGLCQPGLTTSANWWFWF